MSGSLRKIPFNIKTLWCIPYLLFRHKDCIFVTEGSLCGTRQFRKKPAFPGSNSGKDLRCEMKTGFPIVYARYHSFLCHGSLLYSSPLFRGLQPYSSIFCTDRNSDHHRNKRWGQVNIVRFFLDLIRERYFPEQKPAFRFRHHE